MSMKDYIKKKRRQENIKVISTLVLFVLVILGILAIPIIKSTNHHQQTLTVIEKERVAKGEDSKYLIFCEDELGQVVVLENTDSFWNGKFNSSNIYGQLEVGKTYQFDLVGHRVQLLSWYENILYAKEVECR